MTCDEVVTRSACAVDLGVGREEPEELPDGQRFLPQPAGGVWGRGRPELRHPQHEEEAQL